MSKATIVSLLPFKWERELTGHNPPYFQIPAAQKGDIETLVIGDGGSFIYVIDGKSVPRRHLAIEEADELINTYIQASLWVDQNSRPGIFAVEGEFTKEEIKETFPEKLEIARKAQDSWFVNMIKEADDSWKRAQQHRLISDPQRRAAESMGLKRDWLFAQDRAASGMMDCPACGETIKAHVAVCPNCKAHLKEEAENFTFAT